MAQNASADVQHTATFPKTHSTVSMRPLALPVESTLTSSPHPLTSSLTPSPSHALTSSPLHFSLTPSPPPPLTSSPLHSFLTPSPSPLTPSLLYSQVPVTLQSVQHMETVCGHHKTGTNHPGACPSGFSFMLTPLHTSPHSHPHPHTLTLGTRLCLHVTRAKKSVLNLSIYLLI